MLTFGRTQVVVESEGERDTATGKAIVIFNNTRGNFVVRNNNIIAFESGDFGGAEANFFNCALNTVKNNVITDSERTVDIDGKEGKNVFESVLEGESDDDGGDAQAA